MIISFIYGFITYPAPIFVPLTVVYISLVPDMDSFDLFYHQSGKMCKSFH